MYTPTHKLLYTVKHEKAANTCAPTHMSLHVDLLYAVPLHTFLCEEHLTPDLIERQIKGSF